MRQQDQIVKILARNYPSKRKIEKKTLASILAVIKASINAGDRVFELGCGNGRILLPLAKLLPESSFMGIDTSKNMLLQASSYIRENDIRNVKIINLDFDSPELVDLLKEKPPDCFLLFQSVHFSKNPYKLLVRLARFLKRGGKIIIATTTHRQFHELPYCKTFPRAKELELSRTPDLPSLKYLLLKQRFRVKNTRTFQIIRAFRTRQAITRWLIQKPFSVLALLDKKEFENGVGNFTNKYSKKILIDKFTLSSFIKTSSNLRLARE